MTSRWPRTYTRHGCSSSRRRAANAAPGFTLIEVVVAMAILLVVTIGILSAVSFAYTTANGTEMQDTAKNIAEYTVEYLRARTIVNDANNTGLYNLLNPSGSLSTGTYCWYDATNNVSGALPSMMDVGNLPLQSNGYPCNYAAQSSTNLWAAGMKDNGINGAWVNPGSGGGIGAGGAVIHFSSQHAGLPSDTYSSNGGFAWTTTLQGYVSVLDASSLGTSDAKAPEDNNVARIGLTLAGSGAATGTYRTLLTGYWTGLVVRYPGVYQSANPPVIASFTPGSTYAAKVWTTDSNKILTTSQEYSPCYTNGSDGTMKAATQDYRGFRVLTQVIARSTTTATDADGFRHVQYYDVTVTVLWTNGSKESSYNVASRIVAY